MDDAKARPTTEIRAVILNSMDNMFGQLIKRVEGMNDDEYLWEPAANSWSVRRGTDGTVTVDGAGVREIDPAPMTTIAWRMWHIAIDCFDEYTRRFGGDLSDTSDEWTLSSTDAVEMLESKWQGYRDLFNELDWWAQLGEAWGPFSEHCIADMAIHAGNELVHHGAEIALLRDLYRSSPKQ